MLCQVYRSGRKPETYLYVEFGREHSTLPDALLQQLGELSQVMILDLAKRQQLANADIQLVKSALQEQGFYLQLPPGPEEYLRKQSVPDQSQ